MTVTLGPAFAQRAIRRRRGGASRSAEAVLGTVDEHSLMLSGLVEHVEEVSGLGNRNKSAPQVRPWRYDRKRSVPTPIAALGGGRPVMQKGPAGARMQRILGDAG